MPFLKEIQESIDSIRSLFEGQNVNQRINDFLNSQISLLECNINILKGLIVENNESDITQEASETEQIPQEESESKEPISDIGKKTFSLKFVSPNIFGSIAKEGEITIKDLDYSQFEGYSKQQAIKYPPEPLKDEKMNEKLIEEYGITEPLFFYLRFITHPYKTELSQLDNLYLTSLYETENYSEELLRYLMRGTKGETWKYNPDLTKEDEDDPYKGISIIESYFKMIAEVLEGWKDRILIKMTKEELSISIHVKKTKFQDNVPLQWFKDYMMAWGMIHEVITRPLKKI